MVDSMLGSGIRIGCMELVCLLGQMGRSIRENTKKIKKVDMVNFTGLMVRYTKGNGRMVLNPVKVSCYQMVPKRKEYGRMEYWLKNDIYYDILKISR